jgi:hypothetical protein
LSERVRDEPEPDAEQVEDLDVPEQESENVKGGVSLTGWRPPSKPLNPNK